MLFAIGLHIAKTVTMIQSGAAVKRVVDNGSVPNTNGGPTVDAYIALEAADDYLVNYMDDLQIITASVVDMNAL